MARVTKQIAEKRTADAGVTKARTLWETLNKCRSGANLATLVSLTGYSKAYVALGLNRFKDKGHATHTEDGTWLAAGDGPQGLSGRPTRPRCPTCGQRMPPERKR